MKVAVLNFSGNVGKTTVSAHLLKPRMPNASVFSVESINSGADSIGLEIEKVRGAEYGDLINSIMTIDSAIVDIGASNVESFLKKKLPGAANSILIIVAKAVPDNEDHKQKTV